VAACVAQTVERFGGLDIMVHNAYKGGPRHTLEEVDEAFWRPFSRTAMWASYYCAQEAFPHLRKAGARGRLLLITSTSGVDGSTHLPIYSAVKAAQRALAKSLAREWAPYGITVNCLAPVALTPELLANFENTPSLRDRVESGIPLGRIGDPERDIGRVVAFLVSDDASYVTGQTAVSNGGIFTGL
jgi:3-oxoacyl-[acyl-carrier protein] reductase